MSNEQPQNQSETTSDQVRKILEEKNIRVGIKENEDDSFATLVVLKASSFSRPSGLRGRILEVNYDDPEPYLTLAVHGYQTHEKVLLKNIISIDTLE